MDNTQVHEKILYPVTRVRASDSGGSGVMIYSKEDPKHEGQYINIALTCQHVVDKNIKVKALSKIEMKKLGMGAFLSVTQGAAEPPKFIIIEYSGSKGNS